MLKVPKDFNKKEDKNLFITSFFGSREFLSFYILHLLYGRELYGEEISRAISDLSEGRWYPNPGFIYPLLKKLSVQGYIKGEWIVGRTKHPRLVYGITMKGRYYYKRRREEWKEDLKEFIALLKIIDEGGLV